jgi:hypothetical protein
MARKRHKPDEIERAVARRIAPVLRQQAHHLLNGRRATTQRATCRLGSQK